MHILVTGGAGFIGAATCRALIDRGDDVWVFDDLSTGSRETIPDQAQFIHGDVRNLAELRRATENSDVVIHLAAAKSVPRSLLEPRVVNDVNVTGTLNVLIAARDAGVRRVIYASSSSIYGGIESGDASEDLAPKPTSPYAVSKLAGEYYCKVWNELGPTDTVVLRYFNVFGPGQRADSQYAAVIPSFIAAMRRRESVTIHWDGEQSRDFTFIDDVVRANVLAVDLADLGGEVINAAAGEPTTINEVHLRLAALIEESGSPMYTERRAGDVRRSCADSTKAAKLLGWKAAVPLEEGLARTVAWFDLVEK